MRGRTLAFLAFLSCVAHSHAQAVIGIPDVILGVSVNGNLNTPWQPVNGITSNPSSVSYVGLRTGDAELTSTEAGCICEGWGLAAYPVSDSDPVFAGWDNEVYGEGNLVLNSFTSTASSATSVVDVVDPSISSSPLLQITHAFAPSDSDYAFEGTITVENVGPYDLEKTRYRRTMDWDIDPTPFREYVTVGGVESSTAVVLSHNYGFCDANPLCSCTTRSTDTHLNLVDFEDFGPKDQGATFDFEFGALASGETLQFKIFYGVAPTEADAYEALADVEAEVFSLGQSSDTEDHWKDATKSTFFFGFSGVGGTVVAGGGGGPDECNDDQKATCGVFSRCAVDSSAAGFNCTCQTGFEMVDDVCININECAWTNIDQICDRLADCRDTPGSFECECPDGFLGNGMLCVSESWTVRSVWSVTGCAMDFDFSTSAGMEEFKVAYAKALMGEGANVTSQDPMVETAKIYCVDDVYDEGSATPRTEVTINLLRWNEEQANEIVSRVSASDIATLMGADCALVDGPDVYRWSSDKTKGNGNSQGPTSIAPFGMSVEQVQFEPSCLGKPEFKGCWVIDVVYTPGKAEGSEPFNVFYIPKAVGDDSLSYNFDYTGIDSTWAQSPEDTKRPNTAPCTTADYNSGAATPTSITACCLPHFLDMYRPISTFGDALEADFMTSLASCIPATGAPHARDRTVDSDTAPKFESESLSADDAGVWAIPRTGAPGSMGAKGIFVDGNFAGMTLSHGEAAGTIDPYIGIYKAKFYLDEEELRKQAGFLKGTVGVEYTVDTFIGFSQFSPTSSVVLDSFVSQVAIHMEKTNFFSVTTKGSNDYTFLQYINLRLVAILDEDTDFSDTGDTGDDFVRTVSNAAQYLQLTFTMGPQYIPNVGGDEFNGGLIPLDSVRVGHGTPARPSFDENNAFMTYPCYEDWRVEGSDFDVRLDQPCGPGASMCMNPMTEDAVPDQFVSFNIPLGFDYFTTVPDNENNDLSENVFVDVVVNAVDKVAADAGGTPTEGDETHQMKTTITAAIPVVRGGISMFCDGIYVKTDLTEVAKVHIVFGSATTEESLDRLTILRDIASSTMNPNDNPTTFQTASIEAGLMTLVVDGDDDYFERTGYGLEVEDVVTIHIMDPTATPGSELDGTKFQEVLALVEAPGEDNNAGGTLDTDGYCLNDAFYFTIDRAANRVHLEPTTPTRTCNGNALTAICPFNPEPPADGKVAFASCVTRADIRGRDYPHRQNAFSTAVEIVTADEDYDTERAYFMTILGNNNYARNLGQSYADALTSYWNLNPTTGGYDRAYWINPGYEWTPIQTAEESIFTLSQQVILFALININENYGGPTASSPTLPTLPSRRALLQVEDGRHEYDGGGISSAGAKFPVDPQQVFAGALGVSKNNIAIFDVDMKLSNIDACEDDLDKLADKLSTDLEGYAEASASALKAVQVLSISKNMGSETCARRKARIPLAITSTATAAVQMLVAFEEGTQPTFNPETFKSFDAITGVQGVVVDETVNVDDGFVAPPPGDNGDTDDKDEGGGGMSMAVIGGIVGGVVVVIIGGVLGFLYMRSRKPAEVAQPIEIHPVKEAM